jgi:hypothetical protein
MGVLLAHGRRRRPWSSTAEQFDASFHGVDELREFTSVPVLVSIPQIGPVPLKRRFLTGLATVSGDRDDRAHRRRRPHISLTATINSPG